MHECLIYGIEGQTIHIFIEQLNLVHKMKLTDDPRIESTQFDNQQIILTASLSQPSKRQMKKQLYCSGKKHEKQTNSEEEEEEEAKAPTETEKELIFRVFDMVKIKLETTTDFPLDIKATLIFSKQDLEFFDKV